jgi:uncharacterized protein (DUF924 family)
MIKRFFSGSRAQKIFDFWFEGVNDDKSIDLALMDKWFKSDSALNEHLEKEFGEDLKLAIDGKLRHWEHDPKDALSLILLLDQFTRNIYKNTPSAFKHDQKALDITVRCINKGFDKKMWPVHRLFYYLPLEHSESLFVQDFSVKKFNELKTDSKEGLQEFGEIVYQHAISHREVIRQFGRFPTRNKILGRKTTVQEEKYLLNK